MLLVWNGEVTATQLIVMKPQSLNVQGTVKYSVAHPCD